MGKSSSGSLGCDSPPRFSSDVAEPHQCPCRSRGRTVKRVLPQPDRPRHETPVPPPGFLPSPVPIFSFFCGPTATPPSDQEASRGVPPREEGYLQPPLGSAHHLSTCRPPHREPLAPIEHGRFGAVLSSQLG